MTLPPLLQLISLDLMVWSIFVPLFPLLSLIRRRDSKIIFSLSHFSIFSFCGTVRCNPLRSQFFPNGPFGTEHPLLIIGTVHAHGLQ